MRLGSPRPEHTCETCDGADNDADGQTDERFADTDADGRADCVYPETTPTRCATRRRARSARIRSIRSDDDGLSDGDEVGVHGSTPLSADTDDDGLSDHAEVVTYGTDPSDPDTAATSGSTATR